jgi:hypothetical protein
MKNEGAARFKTIQIHSILTCCRFAGDVTFLPSKLRSLVVRICQQFLVRCRRADRICDALVRIVGAIFTGRRTVSAAGVSRIAP